MRCAPRRGKREDPERCAVQYPGLILAERWRQRTRPGSHRAPPPQARADSSKDEVGVAPPR